MYISKSRLVFIGLFVVTVLICLTYAWAQNQNEGDKPYTPTRLEWLAVQLNSELSSFTGVDVGYSARRNNTLELIIRYLPQTDRAILNKIVNLHKKHAIESAKVRGWDTWLKIKENVKMTE